MIAMHDLYDIAFGPVRDWLADRRRVADLLNDSLYYQDTAQFFDRYPRISEIERSQSHRIEDAVFWGIERFPGTFLRGSHLRLTFTTEEDYKHAEAAMADIPFESKLLLYCDPLPILGATRRTQNWYIANGLRRGHHAAVTFAYDPRIDRYSVLEIMDMTAQERLRQALMQPTR